jgi:hypothetical protein
MSQKSKSEEVLESFLTLNNILFGKIEETVNEKGTRRPDYLTQIGELKVVFEVKELVKDENFGVAGDSSSQGIMLNSRVPGAHVRKLIHGSKGQIQWGANQGLPSILLVYNKLDPRFQRFGTDDLDFKTAMYGQLEGLINIETREASELFHGRQNEIQETKNTSFSAVGALTDTYGEPLRVRLFENPYAKVKVPYELLPACFEVTRIHICEGPLSFS